MPRIRRMQSSFTAGVLDPRLAARVNLKAYYEGAEKLDNALCIPQGGATRRPGLKYIATLASGDARLIPFSFNTEQTYMLAATNANIAVYKNDALLVNVGISHTSAQLGEINWTQSADTLIITHRDVAPIKVVRDSTTETTWTVTTIPLTNIPQYDYADASSPTPVNEVQQVNLENTWVGGETFTLTLGTYTTTTLTNNASTASTAIIIRDALRALANTSDDGITVAYSGATNDYDVTFAGDDGAFDWDLMSANIISGGGIISVTSTTDGVTAEEDVWSATRGWPHTVTFFEGRMVFGGSKSRPQGIWMSVTNDFFNFDVGTGLPDEAIVATLDTDQVNEIRSLVPGRTLEIYTSGGEFIVTSSPSLPESFAVARQTSYGTASVRTSSIDGATLYVQRNGQSFREFIYSFSEDAHVSNSISQLSTHLINTPVDIDAARGTTTTDTNYVYLVNTAGDVVILNTLREQNIAAWSGPWTTNASGLFKRVGVLDTDAYFIIQRTINGSTVSYLEKLDYDYLVDSGLQIASHSSATVSGLTHLEGETVKVKIGGAMQPDAVVSSGAITLERTPSAEAIEVGLGFNPTIKTLPVNDNFADGPTLNRKKRIVRCTINKYESLGIIVNGEVIPDRQLDVDTLDAVPQPNSETEEIFLSGWSEKAQVTITQENPVPMTILALDLEVSA